MKTAWIPISLAASLIMIAGVGLNPPSAPRASTIIQPQDGQELAKKSGCLECHSVDKKVTGPAFRDVAARYKNKDGSRDALIQKVAKGGKGNWIEVTRGVPMPPHEKVVSKPDIERLVDWILSQ